MTSLCPRFSVPAPQPFSVHGLSQITNSLYISSGVGGNDKLMLSRYCITTIINVSVEVVNIFYEDIQYVKVPVADSSRASLYEYFDPITDYIRSVEMKQGRTLLHCATGVSRSPTLCMAFLMKYHNMSLLEAHMWTKSCHPIIQPNNSFWEQLVLYEFKLFSKNTVNMISSPVGVIPDLYWKEGYLMM